LLAGFDSFIVPIYDMLVNSLGILVWYTKYMSVQKLLEQFRPLHYSLNLKLSKENKTFSGNVAVKGEVLANYTAIRLHSKDLTIESITVDGHSTTWTYDEDELILHTEESLKYGEHELMLYFSGAITDPMHGIYPCYFEHNGKQKYLLATQFESHHAREVFPCIDEPAAKATFDVTLETAQGEVVLGNMPVAKQSETEHELITTFETSPKMSTYLLAFVVGEMQFKEAHTNKNVIVRAWSTPAQKSESLDYALSIAVRSIEFFESYFGIDYPLPKSDHVALPDFSSGAMENWGLITYRETALLMDPSHSNLESKEIIATVVAHEVSHQWFGNLVTMAWWDDLWLNESFANLMETVAIDHLFPEWNMWLTFAASETVSAMRRDSLPGVQAVHVTVNHPDEISTLFDPAIVYAKGGNLLRMLMHYIGESNFQAGLHTYFKTHAYSNTTGNDLWFALEKASGIDVKAFMEPWLIRSGFPVVVIDQVDASITLSQEQLLIGESEDTANKAVWPIPLNAQPAVFSELFDDATSTATNNEYVLLNHNGVSYYVAHYVQKKHRTALASKLIDGTLGPIDRVRLLNEFILLARAGYLSTIDSLAFIKHYKNETSEACWLVISSIIADTRKLIEADELLLDLLKVYVRAVISNQYQRLGWDEHQSDTIEDIKLRSMIISLAIWSEFDDAKERALDMFTSFHQPADLPVELRDSIYATGAKWLGQTAFDKLFSLYKATDSAEEKDTIVLGLTASRDTGVITSLLGLLTDPSIVRPQDVQRWFIYLLRNYKARDAAWQWMVTHWQWIEKTFGGDKSYDDFPRYAGSTLIGEKWLDTYKTYFTPFSSQPALERNITLGIVDIKARTAWQMRDVPLLKDYLATESFQSNE
jgi:aminopeptidase N